MGRNILKFHVAVMLFISSAIVAYAEEYLWYAGADVSKLYFSADEACSNFNMASIGYPTCTYQSVSQQMCYHKCGNNTMNIVNAGAKPMEYVAIVPEESVQPQQCAANPIILETGAKFQREIDIVAKGEGQVSYERVYNNTISGSAFLWSHTYSRNLRIINPTQLSGVKYISLPFEGKESACLAGWNQIKTGATESWANNVSARYLNNECQLVQNNQIVKVLPITPKGIPGKIKAPLLVQRIGESGSTITFHSRDHINFRAINAEQGTLSYLEGETPIWRYVSRYGDVEEYSWNGNLIRLLSAKGVEQQLVYDQVTGKLLYVQDSTGRRLNFSYTNERVSSINYDTNKTIQYLYNAAGLLTQITYPNNTQRTYHYEDTTFTKHLTGITDERGVRYATWKYDAQGRAISSEHAGGVDKTLIAYSLDGSATVTNPLNKKTIYRFGDIVGIRRVVKVEGQPTASCAGANQNYTYTPEGWLASKTDWKGVQTTYTYNSLGQETSRTEAFGTTEAKTITTEWHPSLYLKTKETEPGRETLYSYDANGNLLSQTVNSLTTP